jgi:putative phosphoesterase
MVKFGIIADTHIQEDDPPEKINKLIRVLKNPFENVDEIIHAGDISSERFLNYLGRIAPITCVSGEDDKIDNLELFIKLKANKYQIGIIHARPEDLETFFKEKNCDILVFGHTHQPLIHSTRYNVLLINPGSPTKPIAPPKKVGFVEPVARPTVITLNIDENDIIATYMIHLKF